MGEINTGILNDIRNFVEKTERTFSVDISSASPIIENTDSTGHKFRFRIGKHIFLGRYEVHFSREFDDFQTKWTHIGTFVYPDGTSNNTVIVDIYDKVMLWVEKTTCNSDPEDDKSKTDYEQKYWDCQRRIDEYERDLAEKDKEIDILKDKKRKAENHIKELNESIDRLEHKVDSLENLHANAVHKFGEERKRRKELEEKSAFSERDCRDCIYYSEIRNNIHCVGCIGQMTDNFVSRLH